MRDKIKAHGLSWHVDSAGTSGHHHGHRPDSRSVDIAASNGLDITEQKSRKITKEDLSEFDLICAMDSSNYINIRMLSSNSANLNKVQLIMNFSQPGMNVNITDPYYGDEGFDRVYEMLDEACEAIIEKFKGA